MPTKETVHLQVNSPVRIKNWKVDVGTIVYEGRVVLLYEEDPPSGKSIKFKSKHVGTVSKLFVREGDIVGPGSAIFEVDIGCSHPTVINDLCAECGADLQRDGQESQATIPMVHSIPQLKVSHEQAQRIGRADTQRLLQDRKLVLLVDLDQTLIHTTHDNIPNNLKDVHHFQLFGSQNPWYHTRLRPGTKHFLTEMDLLYELHICTFGVRPYAHMVAHILDKDAKFFSNRILSRDECFDFNSKHANLHALFPCGDELVCIIDDREDVWNFSPNLIPVKPYHFFKNTGDINDPNLPPMVKTSGYLAKGVKVKSKQTDDEKPEEEAEKENSEEQNEEMIDVEDEDDYLNYLEEILKKVHKCFYDVYDKKLEGETHVRWIISHLKKEVLKGCEIVFSGVVPLKEDQEKSEAWVMAKGLGASVAKDLSPSTTHLVAANDATAKVHKARRAKKPIHIVSPAWLITCAHTWTKAPEDKYPIFGIDEAMAHSMGWKKRGAPHAPPMISLSQEDVDAMKQEVDLSDSDSEEENGSENSRSTSEESGDDTTEDWSKMAEQLEQGLDDSTNDAEALSKP